MSNEQIHQLKRALLDVYGTFADKRITNIDRGDRFIIDGRTDSDIASDGNVYGWFCSMFLVVAAGDQVALTLINLPMSSGVEAWLKEHAEPIGRGGYRIPIARGKQGMLSGLSERVSAITARGKRYDVPSYKYSVPRVVEALERVQRALDCGWDEG
jgi:hypothetical protein